MAILLTWPTITQITTHLPGDGGDDPAIAWNLWWIKYALLNEGINPFQTEAMFYPIGINLAFYTLTLLNGITALPLTLNLGVVTASNLHMLFTFMIGGYGAFLLTRYVLRVSLKDYHQVDHRLLIVSAAIAGGFYAFASSKLFYIALGQFNIGSSHWIPLAILYVLRTRNSPDSVKSPIMAGLFLTLQAWAEMTYASFLLIFIGLYWLYEMLYSLISFRRPAISDQATPNSLIARVMHSIRAPLILIVTFTLGLIPILTQMIPDMISDGDFLVEGEGFATDFSADLFGFIVPPMLHPFLGQLIFQTDIVSFTKGQHIYIGVVLLALLLINVKPIYTQPHIRFWGIAAFIFALLALGPIIIINGWQTGVWGPFNILQHLPFFRGNRYPSRYSVMLMLSLSILAGYSLVYLGIWLKKQRSGGFVGGLLVVALLFTGEHLAAPLPQSDMRVPNAYQIIANDPDEFTVLDIPFAWRNGFRITGALTTQFMFGQFYQTQHQKPLLQGNTSRNPAFKFQYFTQAPVINTLLALETGKQPSEEQIAEDRAIASTVFQFFDIKYIVIRPDLTNNPVVTPQATISYIESALPVGLIHDTPDIKIYQVLRDDDPFSELRVETSDPLAPLFFGEGWGLLSPDNSIAAQRRTSRLLLPLVDRGQTITMRLRTPEDLEAPATTVTLALNGWQSNPQPITKDWQEVSFEIPAAIAHNGLNDVWLQFDKVARLPEFQNQAVIQDITVLSAGQEVGDFGHIFINGYDVSPNQLGYNIATINPQNQLTIDHFNTHLDPNSADAMASFLMAAPSDAIIVVTAADEASANLQETAVLALQSRGATGDLRGCFRCSHAIIRYDGQVKEALEPLQPVGLTTHLGLTEPTIAALIDWIQVHKN
ncbi:MAG: interleukin-like EMT inducer domain-containing protein [Chloroflexota bacterium]